jgi:DNA-binding transcriptional MerR regulator/DNA-directed RNA polymerase subunit RPC12/RpoP
MEETRLYSTGELAGKHGLSVRALQFYDREGLLSPSATSEGGRRLYSEKEEGRLELILEYKALGLSLDEIKEVLSEANPYGLLLQVFKNADLRAQKDLAGAKEREKRLADAISRLESGKPLGNYEGLTLSLREKKSLRATHAALLIGGILLDLAEIGSIVLWILLGLYWPFLAALGFAVLSGFLLVVYYHRRSAYVCPACGERFKPGFKDLLVSAHTARARRLRCPKCHEKHFCVEVPDTKN